MSMIVHDTHTDHIVVVNIINSFCQSSNNGKLDSHCFFADSADAANKIFLWENIYFILITLNGGQPSFHLLEGMMFDRS